MSAREMGPAVIFDLDGVIVDSEIWWDEVRAEFARRHERGWTIEDRAAVMGANSREWSHTMRERLDLPLAPEEIEREVVDGVVARYGNGAPTIDGAGDAVRRIASGHRVAIASSAHHDAIEAALSATGLDDLFEVVVSSDEVPAGKPAPDVYLEAARRLGVDPGECVVVEDSLNGVRAARAAGMSVVLVPNQTIPPQPGARELADVVVDRLAELDPGAVDGAGAPLRRDAVEDGGRGRPRPPGARRPLPIRGRAGRLARYLVTRLVAAVLVRCTVRLRVEGRDRLPGGPAIYCFNHLNWSDPFFLMAALPRWPQLYFFGPKEEDMDAGARNRIMAWSGAAVPYRPGKNDLLEVTRRVEAILDGGAVLGIMGEGRIHARESELLPLNEGAAYFALRAGVPVVPVALNGTSWLRFGGRVRVRIGEPIKPDGRPTRERVDALTEEIWAALHALVADHPEVRPPGRFGRWLTERFNEWPEGPRPR